MGLLKRLDILEYPAFLFEIISVWYIYGVITGVGDDEDRIKWVLEKEV